MSDLAGKVIWIIVLFVSIVLLYSTAIVQNETIDKRSLFIDMCNFTDSVVDGRQVTEAELKEFNNKIASYGFAVDYTITRSVRSVNPDPLNPGKDLPTWMPVDNTTSYNQGDKITVHVWSIGRTKNFMIADQLLNLFAKPFDEQVEARIR